jgi:hypothetical protein
MTKVVSKPLNADESARLAELEKIVEAGQEQWVSVGLALCEIRDKQLFRADYPDFKSYVRERWPFCRQHAYRLMRDAGFLKELGLEESPTGDTRSHRQVRDRLESLGSKALESLSDEQKRQVIEDEEKKAVASAPKTVGGENKGERIEQGLRLVKRAIAVFGGIGPEAEATVTYLEAAEREAEKL